MTSSTAVPPATQEAEKERDDNVRTFIFNVLTNFIRENPSSIFLFVIYLVIILLQDLAVPHFSGRAVNAIQTKQALAKPFIHIIAIIITIQVLSTAIEWQDALLYPRMYSYINTEIIDHIFKKYSTKYAEVDIANVLTRAVRLPNTLFNFLDQMRYIIVPYIFVYAVAVSYMFYNDHILGAIVLVTLIIIFIALFSSPKSCQNIAQSTEYKTNKIGDEMEDVLNNLVSVYSQNQQDYEKQHLNVKQQEYVESAKSLMLCVYRLKLIMFPIMTIFLAAFIYRCYVLVKRNHMNTGQFVALFMTLMYIGNSMWRMINQMRDLIPRWGRILDQLSIFDLTPSPVEPFHPPHPPSTEQAQHEGVLIKDLFYKYPNANRFIIKDLSLHIPDKQKVAIIGRIGCGKSTLLKLIMKYYEPTRGDIYWRGVPYSDITPNQMREIVGYVHQNPVLFNRSIYENISYGLDKTTVTREAINALLRHINMANIFDNVPNGLDGKAGRKGSKLSGGQKQMVWLLRTFFKNPDIIILDEPTASVDSETKQAIQKMLDIVMRNKTVLIVTHDRFLLDVVDRVITMDSGQIIRDELRK